jgi:hypothetical protein
VIKVSKATIQSFRREGKRIARAARSLARGHAIGLRMIGEEIMADVKNSRPGRGVPVDTGALRSTGRVEGGLSGPAILARVTLDFGGPAAPYALIQHERLDYHHPVGEARYLVRGLERWRPGSSAALHATAADFKRRIRREGSSGFGRR